jgi:hypothetical protein
MRISATVRLKITAITVVTLVGFAGFFGFSNGIEKTSASGSGPSASHTNAPGEDNCTSCHTTYTVNSGPGILSISGVPANYHPGQQIQLTISLTQEDAVYYGFQLTALDSQGRKIGTFTLPNETPARVQSINGLVNGQQRTYIEHTIDGLFLPNTFGHNTWTFTWTAPADAVEPVTFYAAANAADGQGSPSGDYIYTKSVTTAAARPTTAFDFDGDGKTDIGIFRPSAGEWWVSRSSDSSVLAAQFGSSADVIAPADFTGDGKTDIAFFRPATSTWYILRSEDFSFYGFQFGASTDVPAPADYDGDGKADPAVYRAGEWYILRSSDSGVTSSTFGVAGDKPVPSDYDGDGKADIGIYRPNGATGGEWWIMRSTAGLFAAPFGTAEDKTVVGDWTGDGKADCAFFRPSTGYWYILRSEDQSYYGFPFGTLTGDSPAPGDYDGDGKFDAGILRQPGAQWYVNKSSGGVISLTFGSAGDVPVSAGYVR